MITEEIHKLYQAKEQLAHSEKSIFYKWLYHVIKRVLLKPSKIIFENGEKDFFQPFMNKWNYFEQADEKFYFFCYKQPKIWRRVYSHYPKMFIGFSYFNYGSAFMLGRIYIREKEAQFDWISCDDDLEHSFILPKNKIEELKIFIQQNYKKENFFVLMKCFISEISENYTFNL